MIPSFRNRILAAVFVFTSLAAFNAKAALPVGVDLGEAGPSQGWAIFTLGNGVGTNLDMAGQASVTGNVGAAGNGNVTLESSQNTIKGDLYQETTGTLTNNGTITGHKHQDSNTDMFLNDAAADAQEASDAAAGLMSTYTVPKTFGGPSNLKITSGQNLTITQSGSVVLNLNNFSVSGTLTLAGGSGTSYVINVSGQFSLTNSAQIVLGMGINPQDVLFNLRGTGSASLVGNTQFKGILLATQRTVSITGSTHVTGEVIANSVNISAQASITALPVTPSTNN